MNDSFINIHKDSSTNNILEKSVTKIHINDDTAECDDTSKAFD